MLLACGSEPIVIPKEKAGEKNAPAAKTAAKKDLVACDVLQQAAIAKVFEISEDIISLDKYGSDVKDCGYKWPKPNKEEIAAANQKRMMEMIKKRSEGGGQDVNIKMVNEDAEIFFNFMPMPNEEAAKAAFAANMENLRKGITATKDDVTATFTINYDVEVSGVGQQAAWSNGKHQLAVQQGNLLLYLKVSALNTVEEDLEKAKALMTDILGRI